MFVVRQRVFWVLVEIHGFEPVATSRIDIGPILEMPEQSKQTSRLPARRSAMASVVMLSPPGFLLNHAAGSASPRRFEFKNGGVVLSHPWPIAVDLFEQDEAKIVEEHVLRAEVMDPAERITLTVVRFVLPPHSSVNERVSVEVPRREATAIQTRTVR